MMMDSLTKLKTLLEIRSDEYDIKLQLIWDMLAAQVLTYLGRQDNHLSPGLEGIILQMAVDYLHQNNMGIAAISADNVKTVQRGDTAITYNIAEMASAGAFVRLYDDLLWPFKRVVMR